MYCDNCGLSKDECTCWCQGCGLAHSDCMCGIDLEKEEKIKWLKDEIESCKDKIKKCKKGISISKEDTFDYMAFEELLRQHNFYLDIFERELELIKKEYDEQLKNKVVIK